MAGCVSAERIAPLVSFVSPTCFALLLLWPQAFAFLLLSLVPSLSVSEYVSLALSSRLSFARALLLFLSFASPLGPRESNIRNFRRCRASQCRFLYAALVFFLSLSLPPSSFLFYKPVVRLEHEISPRSSLDLVRTSGQRYAING